MTLDSNQYQQRPFPTLRRSIGASFVLFFCLVQTAIALTPAELKTEYMVNSQGVDVQSPRLSWILTATGRAQKQAAFQIQVADSAEQLNSRGGVDWDSGKVNSDRNFGIVYGGPDLPSGSRRYWRVRVWDQDGKASAWSPAAWWEMGLLRPADWKGKWIGGPTAMTCPLLRDEFRLDKKIKKATAYVFGFGFYELHLNGAKVGNNVLEPVNSNYGKYIYYDTYDVTSLVKVGGNAAGLWLGNGYDRDFNQYGYRWMNSKQAILEIEIQFVDGARLSIVTDESWKAAESPILANSIYNGETYDARQEKTGWDQFGYDDHVWQPVTLFPAPGVPLRSRLMPPIRVNATLRPRRMHQLKPGVFVFDLGQNIAGWMRLHARGAAGTSIVMRHAEDLNADGTLNTTTNRAARATDTFILKGSGVEVYEPRFTYHGFRYVELTGFPGTPTLDSLEGRAIHAAFQPVGEFQSSNPLLKRIQSNFQWSLMNNLVGIPTDNPTRNERTPCQMDSMMAEETALYNFDMNNYYTKWLMDIAGERDAPNWSGDQVLLAWLLYQHYGNRRVLEDNYENSKQLVDAFAVQAGKKNPWSDAFGDWCPPGRSGHYQDCFSEGEIVNTSIYYRATLLVAQMAEVLGKNSDALTYRERAESILRDFTARQYNGATHTYGSGQQVTSIMPLAFDMAPPDQKAAAAHALFERLMGKDHAHLDTGIFGTRYLFDVLIDNGFADAAYTALTQTTYPSYGNQISLGATTTWEQWHFIGGMETHDHAMFAGPGSTFYSRLGGIRPAQPGYKEILIRPAFPKGLTWVNCSLRTVMGEIVSNWKFQNGLTQQITIPPNATAIVYVSAADVAQVKEGGRAAAQAEGVKFLRQENGSAVFSVGSGTYRFAVPSGEVNAHATSVGSPQH
jgi:alpha-L-rhamnosidase